MIDVATRRVCQDQRYTIVRDLIVTIDKVALRSGWRVVEPSLVAVGRRRYRKAVTRKMSADNERRPAEVAAARLISYRFHAATSPPPEMRTSAVPVGFCVPEHAAGRRGLAAVLSPS